MRKIKTGDTVKILSGKDKGKTGEVVAMLEKGDKVVVKGINIITRHQKQTTTKKSGIIKIEAPIFASKVMVIDADGKPSRVKFDVDAKTKKKVRVSIKNNKKID